MWNNGNGMRFRESGDLAGLRDAAHPVCIKLYVIDRASRKQIAKPILGKLVFTSGNWNSPIRFQLSVTVNVIRDDWLLQPAQLKRLEQRQHALGVVECPAHVSVGHHIYFASSRLAHRTDQFNVALHACSTVGRAPS